MLLDGSWRCGGYSCRPSRAYPYPPPPQKKKKEKNVPQRLCIQPRGHTTAPRISPLSVRLGIWSGWVVKEEKVRQKAYVPESQQNSQGENEKKMKKGKSADEPDSPINNINVCMYTVHTVLYAGGSPISRDLYPCSRRAARTGGNWHKRLSKSWLYLT